MSKFFVSLAKLCGRYGAGNGTGSRGGVIWPKLFMLNFDVFGTLKAIGFKNPFAKNGSDTAWSKHWEGTAIEDVLKLADQLSKADKHYEVYELLNQMKYASNSEAQWRISRALFKMSCSRDVSEKVRKEMIWEAHNIIIRALPDGENCPQIHKWAAIIIDRKNGMSGIDCRVKNSETVKNHLIKCCELDPSDVTAQYLLGRWCYEMSNITWFQRIIAKMLYGDPPKSTFEEAHKYLSKAEDLHPKFFLQNTYMLGKTCLKLGQYYKAKHYFMVVSSLPASTDYEKQCVADAKKMVKRLAKYDLEKKVLFYEYPFGTEEQ